MVKGHLSIISSISILFFHIPWFFYTQHKYYGFLSLLCILFSIILVFFTVRVTWHILRPPHKSNFDESSGVKPNDSNYDIFTEEIKKQKFANVFFFLGIFLCVTYLLTFANAFHDKYTRTLGRQALLTKPVIAYAKNQHFSSNENDEISSGNHTPGRDAEDLENLLRHPVFLFYTSDYTISIENNDQDITTLEDLDKFTYEEILVDGGKKNSKDIKEAVEKKYIHLWNKFTINSIVSKLREIHNGKSVTITLIGHANEDQVRPNSEVANNADLSNYRATKAMTKINRTVLEDSETQWPIIHYIPHGVSSSTNFWTPLLKGLSREKKKFVDEERKKERKKR